MFFKFKSFIRVAIPQTFSCEVVMVSQIEKARVNISGLIYTPPPATPLP